MTIWRDLFSLFVPPPRHVVAAAPPKLLLTQSCWEAVRQALDPEIRKGHEGIVYLLGRTDGTVTLAVSVFRPRAVTTAGSFHVEPKAMAACVHAAGQFELQVVAQLHTHPGQAYHSDGDVEGARIRYPGYASIVLPDYGRRFPRLDGVAAYLWGAGRGWVELGQKDIIIIPGSGPWTSSVGTTSATTAR